MAQNKTMRIILFVFLPFLIVFLSISLVNHYLFRTSALDMGTYNHALYNYSHFKLSYFTLGLSDKETGIVECFGDHFSPFFFILTPFYYLFGSYTLLILQIAFILLGGFGVYKYASLLLENQNLIILLTVHFFSIWGIYSALSFDFHMNVIAAMLVPWLFYFYRKQNIQMLILIFVFMLLTRENVSLWLIFILAGLWINNNFKPLHGSRYLLTILIVSATVYFGLAVKYIMPSFVPYESTGQFSRYSYFGQNLTEILYSIITQPGQTIHLLFFSPLPEEVYRSVKTELHLMVILSGGFLFLYRPAFLIMLVPVFLQKLLSTEFTMWGINYHYSIEFVPILSLLTIESVAKIRKQKLKTALVSVVLALTVTSTVYTLYHRESVWYDKAKTCFLSTKHYKSDLNIQSIYATIGQIPREVSVSSHSSLAPHLAFRQNIYHFPIIKDADYIALLKKAQSYYPISEEDYQKRIEELRIDQNYLIWKENESVIIFKHKGQSDENH